MKKKLAKVLSMCGILFFYLASLVDAKVTETHLTIMYKELMK